MMNHTVIKKKRIKALKIKAITVNKTAPFLQKDLISTRIGKTRRMLVIQIKLRTPTTTIGTKVLTSASKARIRMLEQIVSQVDTLATASTSMA